MTKKERRQLDRWLAKHVMGWKRKRQYSQSLRKNFYAYVPGEGQPQVPGMDWMHEDDWFPTENWLQVKELIAALSGSYNRWFMDHLGVVVTYFGDDETWLCHVIPAASEYDKVEGESVETSELAVCTALRKFVETIMV